MQTLDKMCISEQTSILSYIYFLQTIKGRKWFVRKCTNLFDFVVLHQCIFERSFLQTWLAVAQHPRSSLQHTYNDTQDTRHTHREKERRQLSTALIAEVSAWTLCLRSFLFPLSPDSGTLMFLASYSGNQAHHVCSINHSVPKINAGFMPALYHIYVWHSSATLDCLFFCIAQGSCRNTNWYMYYT